MKAGVPICLWCLQSQNVRSYNRASYSYIGLVDRTVIEETSGS